MGEGREDEARHCNPSAAPGAPTGGTPTKLALSPDFADRIEAALTRDGIRPATHPPLPDLPRPAVTGPFWEGLL